MEMPLVSIIVPVYNAQSHLSRCLESICGQEYKNLELIVINDGSKDKSLPVCEEFRKKDSRILLVDKANSGVSDTRNLGLKLAGGKYVQFVDSDDYIAPDYTARLVEAAEHFHMATEMPEEVQRVLLTEIMDNQVWPEVAVAIRVVQLEKE